MSVTSVDVVVEVNNPHRGVALATAKGKKSVRNSSFWGKWWFGRVVTLNMQVIIKTAASFCMLLAFVYE